MAMRTDANPLEPIRVGVAILGEEKCIVPKTISNTPVGTGMQIQSAYVANSVSSSNTRTSASQVDSAGVTRHRRVSGNQTPRRHPYPRTPCAFCKGTNHLESYCYLKFPEKHPSHPNYVAPIPKPEPSSASRTSPHTAATVSHTPDDSSAVRPKFEWLYAANEMTVGNGQHDWMLDSGCSTHYIRWKECFKSFTTPKRPIKVVTVSSKVKGLAIRLVDLTLESGPVELGEGVFAPDLTTNCNLLSIPRLNNKGFSTTFGNNRA